MNICCCCVTLQKNECGNKSNLIEIEGLIRTIRWLDNQDVSVSSIVTDRHRQIAKYLREQLVPRGVTHYYDVWHVAKGKYHSHLKIMMCDSSIVHDIHINNSHKCLIIK